MREPDEEEVCVISISATFMKRNCIHPVWFYAFLFYPWQDSSRTALGDSPSHHQGSTTESTRAGLQQVLQVFITNSANVFLLEAPADQKSKDSQQFVRLEEQVSLMNST